VTQTKICPNKAQLAHYLHSSHAIYTRALRYIKTRYTVPTWPHLR